MVLAKTFPTGHLLSKKPVLKEAQVRHATPLDDSFFFLLKTIRPSPLLCCRKQSSYVVNCLLVHFYFCIFMISIRIIIFRWTVENRVLFACVLLLTLSSLVVEVNVEKLGIVELAILPESGAPAFGHLL